MDGPRFDAWTRRAVGIAASGLIATLLGSLGENASQARGNKKKKRCRRAGQRCRPSGQRKRCCKHLACATAAGESERHCCRQVQASCHVASECCGELLCNEIFPDSGLRCCAPGGVACSEDNDCCIGNVCTPSGACGD